MATPGYDLWVGGGLSTNPKLAVRLGVFVTPEQLPDVWAGVISIFRDYGYRRSRTRARLKFLIADWGPEHFREVLETEYLGYALADGPAPAVPQSKRRDHVGVTELRDGTFAVGFAPRVGRVSGTKLLEVAELADRFGSGQIRTTTEQKMIIVGVTDVDGLVAELAKIDLQVLPSAFRRSTMACTGLEFCKLAIVETKARASELIDELERRMPDFDEPIGINVNGCPNACARFQVADIGLKGSLIGGEEGFQIHLGGSLGVEAALGRKVRGLKVTSAELPDFVERILLVLPGRPRRGRDLRLLGTPRRRVSAAVELPSTLIDTCLRDRLNDRLTAFRHRPRPAASARSRSTARIAARKISSRWATAAAGGASSCNRRFVLRGDGVGPPGEQPVQGQ